MSDFVPSDILPDLWEEILQRHWTFLETEEGVQKLEERKKLEDCLKEFLCIVPHDRKFFLPETAFVLRQSIREMDNFSANKAIVGFQSISQYANNLFTKPWRKEFRILKTYSGFFQHEINSNLVEAVKLFEAMGYRRLSDDILILDGPICPDQVTNVSRDAMAAYVECQIMKYVYAGLSALGIKCSWQDIYLYREKYKGSASQAIKDIAYAIQERRRRKEKLLTDNSYASIQHLPGSIPAPPPPPVVSQCSNCAPYHHNIVPMPNYMHAQPQQCLLHSNQITTGCALHPANAKVNLLCNGGNNSKLFSSYPAPGNYQSQLDSTQLAPHMSHSRSLEHYNEPPPLLPHRHSFDHQQHGCTAHQGHYQVPRSHVQFAQHLYESPYDYIDGSGGNDSIEDSSVSYAAVANPNSTQTAVGYAHPYNVSGNRVPLPYNISNQLSSHYNTPASVTCNGVKGTDPYSSIENAYATVSKPSRNCGYHSTAQHQPPLPPSINVSTQANVVPKDFQNYRQRSFPPDQLIDFDDHAPLTSHDFHAQQHMHMHGDYGYRSSRANGLNPTYAEPKDLLRHQEALAPISATATITSSDDAYGSNLYARPVPRSSRIKQTTDKYLRTTDCTQGHVDNNHKMPMELNGRTTSERINGVPRRKLSNHTNDTSDMSYESATFDDFVTVGHSEHPQRSPTQAVKNQDGVGSFESWNFVFQNLERSGYSKDLGDRGDLLVQSLDLNSLNLEGGGSSSGGGGVAGGGGAGGPNQITEKQRPSATNNVAETKRQASKQVNGDKNRTLEKVSSAEKRDAKPVKKEKTSILKQSTATATANGVDIKKTKSALKPTASMTATAEHSKSNGTTMRSTKRQNSNSNNHSVDAYASSTATTTTTKRAPSVRQVAVPTQVVINNSDEWGCRYCTFLNPGSKRICEMCCKSKDFNLEATVSNTPTCV